MGNARWLGWVMVVCANTMIIFQNYIVTNAVLIYPKFVVLIIILIVGAGICFEINGKEIKE